MLILILGLVIFIGAHLVPTRPALKASLVGRVGAGGYKGAFSLASLLGLVLIVWGYGLARSEGAFVLWDAPVWTRHLAATLMIPVFPLLFATYLPGRIKAAVKHPMLTAVKLWALSHLIANGTVPDLLLFGGLLAYAVFDRISVKRRGVPNPAPVAGWTRNDTIALVGGLVVYVAFVLRLHVWLIGVSPV